MKKKVLVIDDSEVFCEGVKELFSGLNIEVKSIYTGEEGLELIDTEEFDLIILDVFLPDINGYEVLKKIRENPKTQQLKVLLATSNQEVENLVQLEKETELANDCFLKSSSSHLLIEKVNNLVQ